MKKHTTAIFKRVRRVRSMIHGTASRPRLSVDRSSKHLFAQLIDDSSHKTIFGLSTKTIKEGKTKTEKAISLGKTIAQNALEKGIQMATFDRGALRYGGRIKSLADAAREAGLKI